MWTNFDFHHFPGLQLIQGIVMQAEAKYYCVDELVLGTEQSLGKLGVEVRLVYILISNLSRSKMIADFKGSDVVPICRVSLITSRREEQALMAANNMKPVIKLIINR